MEKNYLNLGPVLFNWPAEYWRDFYFKIADETDIDTVYLGEIICSKRLPFFEKVMPSVIERLEKSKKRVILSSLSEVMIKRDRKIVEETCNIDSYLIEANDSSALFHLREKPHHIGPFINVYNEKSLSYLAGLGACHFTLPPEMDKRAIQNIVNLNTNRKIEFEVLVYGRVSLALSARCYHARAHGKSKDNCQFVCEKDMDGMVLKTFNDKNFLTINGIQTLSYNYFNLIQEIDLLKEMGINSFRISPHTQDMLKIISIFKDRINNKESTQRSLDNLKKISPEIPFCNGFFYHKPGHEWIETAQTGN